MMLGTASMSAILGAGPSRAWISLGLSLAAFAAYVLYYLFFNGLSRIPGPIIAKLSNWWKISAAWHEDMPRRNLDLHRKYGPLVRIGPNMVSVDDPASHPIIYGFKPIWQKSAFYPIVEALYKGRSVETLFSTVNETYHSQLKRGSAKAYALSSLVGLESQIQPTIGLFMDKLAELGDGGRKPVDMATWAGYFSFDGLGQINFSADIGFLRAGTDIGDNMRTLNGLLAYLSVVGQAPWLHRLLLGNRLLQRVLPLESSNKVQQFAIRIIQRRLDGQQPDAGRDVLAHFLEAYLDEGKTTRLTMQEVISLTTVNLIAGADTTALGIRAILYYLCRNPGAYARLRRELDEAVAAGELSDPPRYTETAKLPYLDAVIVEGLRVHPGTGFVLERTVPPGGATIAGEFMPTGTIVGINSWVMHANKSVYGDDAESFRPERWLESDEEKLKEMKRYNMTFGAGKRACIGKNISLMMLSKLLPTILLRFDLRLADPDKEWKVLGHWFTPQSDMDMFITPRNI